MRVQELGGIDSTHVCSSFYGNLELPNELPTTYTYKVREKRKDLHLNGHCFTNSCEETSDVLRKDGKADYTKRVYR
jgi:hypothetical protein